MQIQWYPGHMYKAQREIKKLISQVDVSIEILDARIPFSSQNPLLATIQGEKPRIKVLNKSDLADPNRTRIWQEFFNQAQSQKTLACDIDHPQTILQIPDLIHKLVPNCPVDKPIKAVVMGIPNVGKSSLINALVGRRIAKTGDEPAVTQRQQTILLSDTITLVDTPGMLWPRIGNERMGYRLATTGAIKDTALANDDVGLFAAEFLLDHYPDLLISRYGWSELPASGIAALDQLGKQRGCLVRGGLVDYEKAGKALISDIRSGRLGRISWETPDCMQRDLQEIADNEAARAEKKRQRKAHQKKSST